MAGAVDEKTSVISEEDLIFRNSKITRIISGGQTGADQAALDVAIEKGIPHGGWIPKGEAKASRGYGNNRRIGRRASVR